MRHWFVLEAHIIDPTDFNNTLSKQKQLSHKSSYINKHFNK
jgi:hypothetical protein